LKNCQASEVRILLDRPVSNSGRLREQIEKAASELSVPLQVDLVPNPDPLLTRLDQGRKNRREVLISTADSAILDGCRSWIDLLASCPLEESVIVDLG
jgi:hypothetical protein